MARQDEYVDEEAPTVVFDRTSRPNAISASTQASHAAPAARGPGSAGRGSPAALPQAEGAPTGPRPSQRGQSSRGGRVVAQDGNLPDVLTSREAATALRMGVKELRQLIERGELPAARLGPRRVIRIAKTAILGLLRGEPRERPLVPPADDTVGPCKPARRRWKGRPS